MSAEDEMDRETPAEPTAAEPTPAEPAAGEPTAAKESPTAEASPAPAAKTSATTAPGEKEPAAAKSAAAKPAAPKKRSRTKAPAAGEAPAETKRQRTPRLRKGAKKQAPTRRVVRAHARYVRTSARKARMVCGHLRGKSVQEARAILAFTPRDVARDWSKLLESAVANAESNHELLEDDLVIREAYADEGPTIKRVRPRAMGRATPIRKRTSHLTIALTPGDTTRTTNR
jgi:ribosomal protein L22